MQEELKITKGPWHRNGLNGVQSIDGTIVSVVTRDGHLNNETIAANARLIAAAPELYEALEDGLELLRYIKSAIPYGNVLDTINNFEIVARAALKKSQRRISYGQ